VEICAGAGGQALGLEQAGFEHALAVELDANAAETLRFNRPHWKVACGDVADEDVWNPDDYKGVALLAGGVPCPPFSIAGKQLGANDERDLFAWAVELAGRIQPRALMLENVRGLSAPRFSAYRQHVLDRLAELNYIGDWRLLQASDFGVPQLRPRFVLVALRPEDAPYFTWPEPTPTAETIGSTLVDLMASAGWPYADQWKETACAIAPTIVGGSKKHGGADLGPTRAKRAWAELGVDALGLADAPPPADWPADKKPKLTVEMVARIQGWQDDWKWTFTGRKTARYRQIGNAFPPPVACAVGSAVLRALKHEGEPHSLPELAEPTPHDSVYRVLRSATDHLTVERIIAKLDEPCDVQTVERRLAYLGKDFIIDVKDTTRGPAYRLGDFRAFVGQQDHRRHEYMEQFRARVS
jgi:DNA (cytosine-5)-methyltransferase 1